MPIFTIYTVQAGDTLWDIAQRSGVSVQTLARLNGLRDPDRLYPGQRLRIPRLPTAPEPPACPTPTPPPGQTLYVVQPGDTLGDIAFRFGTTVPVLLRLNRLDDPDVLAVGQELLVPAAPSGENLYEVQPGDTLYHIAQATDTTVEELIRLNNIRTPNLIYPGERLRLP